MTDTPSNLELLQVYRDPTPRPAAENLALDEALLDSTHAPILRFYQWQAPAVTMGYFQRWQEMPLESFGDSDIEIARRWTGGGLVDHRHDLPYSLIVPAGHWLSAAPATHSYRWIHERLARALRQVAGLDVSAADAARSEPPASAQGAMVCFTAPVAWDVIEAGSGRKISGAAQRRSRQRLLHQGSVIIPGHGRNRTDGDDWRNAFAGCLSSTRAVDWSPPAATLDAAADLANQKYATRKWRERF